MMRRGAFPRFSPSPSGAFLARPPPPPAMAAAERTLSRWARLEMELPPAACPSPPVLRRLCSGSSAPIWEFITHHVRHPRNVQKIRGNLLWYRYLEEAKGAGPAQGVLGGAVSRLQQELGGLGGALGGAQEAALELEAALEAGQSQRGEELRRSLELRLVGELVAGVGQRLQRGRDILQLPPMQEEVGPELLSAIATGVEPEVLTAVRAVCDLRAEELELMLEPRPAAESQPITEAEGQRWLQAAQAVLSRHPPRAVLWALQRLASDRPPLREAELDHDPALDAEALPTTTHLIQECWGAVGGLWGRLHPLAARLSPLGSRLAQLRLQLTERLGGDPKAQEAVRLALLAAGLAGGQRVLARGVKELQGAGTPPKRTLEELQHRLQRAKHRLSQRKQQLEALGVATATLKARLRPLQAQVQEVARVKLGRAPPALSEEGERVREALGALGALGELLPRSAPDPMAPVCDALGLSRGKDRQEALCQAVELQQELRLGAWLQEEAGSPLPCPLPVHIVGGASSELLPRLRVVADKTRQRIETWPQLQTLVTQWWEQPAQWTLAPPPGDIPFSHWLQRWTRATQALAPPCPLPLASAPPPQDTDGRGPGEPHS